MSDKKLNKIHIITKQPGVVFSQKERSKDNAELMSELDRRINDILHKIEFANFNPQQAYKLMMKLQSFLKKKRALKSSGKIYVPRTESGNYIVDGKITNEKRFKQ